MFELKNNQSLLHLDFVPEYMSLDEDAETGEYHIPMAEPMKFCENCPEYWKIPVE